MLLSVSTTRHDAHVCELWSSTAASWQCPETYGLMLTLLGERKFIMVSTTQVSTKRVWVLARVCPSDVVSQIDVS